MSVPKILHFVWVGDEGRRPDGCIRSWKELNPDYEVKVWGNDDLLRRDWINRHHMAEMVDVELCGVADMMRYELLYEFGGIALDADSLCVRPLEDWVIEPDDFTCWSNEHALGPLLANGVMGAVPESPYVAAVIMDINGRENVTDEPAWITTGPRVTTRIWQRHQYPLTVWPSHMFLPQYHSGPDYAGSGPVFAHQFYGSTYNINRTDGSNSYDEISKINTDS